jgi:hypothetical protein
MSRESAPRAPWSKIENSSFARPTAQASPSKAVAPRIKVGDRWVKDDSTVEKAPTAPRLTLESLQRMNAESDAMNRTNYDPRAMGYESVQF